jgi:hypothetical protein
VLGFLELAQCTLRLLAEGSIDRFNIIALSEQGSLDRPDLISQTSYSRSIDLSGNGEVLGFLELAQCTLRLRAEFSVYLPYVITLPLQGSLDLPDSIATYFNSGGFGARTGRCSHERLRRCRHAQAQGECRDRWKDRFPHGLTPLVDPEDFSPRRFGQHWRLCKAAARQSQQNGALARPAWCTRRSVGAADQFQDLMSFAPNTFLEAFCDSHYANLPLLAPHFPILIGELIKHTRRRPLQVRIQRRLNVCPNHALCVAEYIGHWRYSAA